MRMVFTKGAGKHDTLDVLREGVPATRIDCPKQGIVPHEMVHYAVETTLGARGFVRRLARGEHATYRMQPEPVSDAVERLVETLQGDGWSGWTGTPADLLDLYAVTCRARGCPALPLRAADIQAVRTHLLALGAAWDALPVGGVLALDVAATAPAP